MPAYTNPFSNKYKHTKHYTYKGMKTFPYSHGAKKKQKRKRERPREYSDERERCFYLLRDMFAFENSNVLSLVAFFEKVYYFSYIISTYIAVPIYLYGGHRETQRE